MAAVPVHLGDVTFVSKFWHTALPEIRIGLVQGTGAVVEAIPLADIAVLAGTTVEVVKDTLLAMTVGTGEVPVGKNIGLLWFTVNDLDLTLDTDCTTRCYLWILKDLLQF